MKNDIYAHGATSPVLFRVPKKKRGRTPKWPAVELLFGTTLAIEEDYPVAFYGIENIKNLHAWLGKKIAEYERSQK